MSKFQEMVKDREACLSQTQLSDRTVAAGKILKTPESPLDSKEIKLVNLKGNQP